jgi:hypothetical protein
MTRTAALPTYEEFLAGCRKDAAERALVERRGDHAVVTMHDPARLNALSGRLTVQRTAGRARGRAGAGSETSSAASQSSWCAPTPP